MTLSTIKSETSKQLQSNALNVFENLMFYQDKLAESDLDVFLNHLRPELQESLMSEVRENVLFIGMW